MEPRRQTVLVVDDDEALRTLCRINLELEGYRVLEAAGVGEGREALAGGGVDVALLDRRLGVEDGLDLLREARAEQPGVGIVLFTGEAELEPEARALVDGVLGKPFELEQLYEVVHRVCPRPAR